VVKDTKTHLKNCFRALADKNAADNCISMERLIEIFAENALTEEDIRYLTQMLKPNEQGMVNFGSLIEQVYD